MVIISNKKHFRSYISSTGLIGLYFYYTILTLFGIGLLIYVTIVNNFGYDPFISFNKFFTSKINGDISINLYNLAFLGSISSSLVGASVSYIQKIYQMSIGNYFNIEESSYCQNFGSLLYFIYRPIFAVIFSSVIFIGLKIGIIPILNTNSEVNGITVDLCMFISFFIGLKCGDILSVLEKKGNKIVENIASSIDNM